jgi:hypothetical protein
MRREELYLADLIDNARAVRGYLDGVTRERWDAKDYEAEPASDPGTESLPDHGRRGLPG